MANRQVFIDSDKKGTTRLFTSTLNQVKHLLFPFAVYEMKPTRVEGKDAVYIEAANDKDSIIMIVEVLKNETPKLITTLLKLDQDLKKTAYANPLSPKAQKFISKKIEILIREGYPQKQAVAIAYQYARDKGFKIPRK